MGMEELAKLYKVQIEETGQWKTVDKSKNITSANEKYDALYPEYENVRLVRETLIQDSRRKCLGEWSIEILHQKV